MTLLRNKLRRKKKVESRRWRNHWSWLDDGFSVKPGVNFSKKIKEGGLTEDDYQFNCDLYIGRIPYLFP